MNRLQEINERLQAISGEIETRGTGITAEQLTALETEVTALTEERAGILAAEQRRQTMLSAIAEGNTEARALAAMGAGGSGSEPEDGAGSPDRFDTPQYRRHFMEFVCRGTAIPTEYRAAATTTTADVGAVIPTTILSEIIKEAESYGNIFRRVRRLNIQGGVSVPILTLIPEAKWITEKQPSETQKLQAEKYVKFDYHGLECRIAQTLLVSVVTLAEFQRQFVPLAAEALVKAIEIAIFNGTGNGQMLGVLKETRIPTKNVITLSAAEFKEWGEWKKKVFAKMKKSYRNGTFVMAQGTFDGYIDGMVDTTGQPIGRINYGIAGGETYRFGGREIETVEDEVLPAYEDAEVGDVVAVFMRFGDYGVNTNLQMRVVHWVDNDTNELKNKCIMILDGKVLDPHGILLIKKGG